MLSLPRADSRGGLSLAYRVFSLPRSAFSCVLTALQCLSLCFPTRSAAPLPAHRIRSHPFQSHFLTPPGARLIASSSSSSLSCSLSSSPSVLVAVRVGEYAFVCLCGGVWMRPIESSQLFGRRSGAHG